LSDKKIEFRRLTKIRNTLPTIHGKRQASGSVLKSVNASASDIDSLIYILGSLVHRHKVLVARHGK
jgi:hypothetical protein